MAGLLAGGAALAWSFARTPLSERARESQVPGSTPERRERIEESRSRLSANTTALPNADTGHRSSAELFTELAETSQESSAVLAALEGIEKTYAARSPHKAAPDARLERVLLKLAQSPHPSIAMSALSKARIPLMAEAPGSIITEGLIAMSAPDQDPSRRHAALDALNLIRPDRRGTQVLAAFESALSAREAHLVSLALLSLAQSGPSLGSDLQRLGARVVELSKHQDPGVRGRALAVLAEIEALVDGATRVRVAREHLERDHPYVRAQAADLVARCRDVTAIHRLIEQVRDLSVARYDLQGFRYLDGSPGSLPHAVPGRKRVAEAALFAIQSLSTQVRGVGSLELTLGGPRIPDELVLENAELAHNWYRRAEAALRNVGSF